MDMNKKKKIRMMELAERIEEETKRKFIWDDYKLMCEYKVWLKGKEENKYKDVIRIDELDGKYIVHTYTEAPWMMYKQYYYLVEMEEELMTLIWEGL